MPRIFQELENGNMRIPRFQRAYVWERTKIVSLLNSIYKQYPIGSFFLWDTDMRMDGFCRDITELGFPNKPEASKFSFILDGQQRITSLYVALRGKTLNDVDYSKGRQLQRVCYLTWHIYFEQDSTGLSYRRQSGYNHRIMLTENDGTYTGSFQMPTKGTVLEILTEPDEWDYADQN